MSVTVVWVAGLAGSLAGGRCCGSARRDSAGWGGDGRGCLGGMVRTGGVLDLASTGEDSGLAGGRSRLGGVGLRRLVAG